MNEDMSDIINKLSGMLKNNEIPGNITDLMNNISNSNSNNDVSSSPSNTSDIDINTILKMKNIIDSMNTQKDDPRANLLRSLKPYLKESRKEKVEQYIKLFSMGKVFDLINSLGGDKKNDV